MKAILRSYYRDESFSDTYPDLPDGFDFTNPEAAPFPVGSNQRLLRIPSYRELDAFTRAYVECALWSTTDESTESGGEPFDKNYGPEDIAPETLARMAEDCRQFQENNAADLCESGCDDGRAGFLFWLNRHGSGFWDEGNDPVFRRLSDVSKVWGTFDLYLGDDGQIYGS